MNSEHFERQMDFIIDQQAKIVVDAQKLYEAQAVTERKLAETQETVRATEEAVKATIEAVGVTTEVVTRLAHVTNVGFKDVTAKIDALVDSHISLRDAQQRSDEQFNARINTLIDAQQQSDERFSAKINMLADSQKKTDETLRRLESTVDRFLKNRQNGH